MSIKIIKTKDAALLAKLNEDVQRIHNNIEPDIFKPYSKKDSTMYFDELLKNKNISAYLAKYNEDIVGYILFSIKYNEENFIKKSYSVLYIDQICIEKNYKGNGIGKELVEFAKDYAKKMNIIRVEMNYWSKNSDSGEFFKRQGFETYNERLVIKV